MGYQNFSEVEFTRLSSLIREKIDLLTKEVQRMVDGDQPATNHKQTTLAREINALIKNLSQLPQPANISDRRQRNFVQDKLTNDFSEALKNIQLIHRAKMSTPKEVLIDIPDDQQQQQQVQKQKTTNTQELRERDEAVRGLEQDIVEVNQIFKELATMIHQQGETVDSIESSIFRATDEVSRGAQEIARARNYQDKSRRKKFYLAMILFFILIVVIIFLVSGN